MTTVLIQILGLGIIILLFIYRHKQLQYQKTITFIRTEKEKSILSAQIEIQEETIQHISREIHDNIGLSLTLAKLNLNTLANTIQNENSEKIKLTTSLLSKAIEDLRSISHSMNNEIIKTHGLLKALKDEIERIKKLTNLEFAFSTSGNYQFIDPQKELLLFRVTQECINNILKHSNANNVRVEINFEDTYLETLICDDGIGLDLVKLKNTKGSGILTMASRLSTLGGNLEVNSSVNGTKITINLPY